MTTPKEGKAEELGVLIVEDGPNMETLLFRLSCERLVKFRGWLVIDGKKHKEEIIFRVTGVKRIPEKPHPKDEVSPRAVPEFSSTCIVMGYMNMDANVERGEFSYIIQDWWFVSIHYNWHTRRGLIRNRNAIANFWSPEAIKRRHERLTRPIRDDDDDDDGTL